jgi:hypothetical protein
MSIVTFVLGLAALVGSGWLLNYLRPREGRVQPAWVRTDFGSNAVGLGIIVLGLIGFGLMIKSFTG